MFSLVDRSFLQAPAPQRANCCLDIALKAEDEQTRVSRFYQEGCLKARHLRHKNMLEIVSMNISGGIAGGDVLTSRVELGAGTRSVFTSQAAERIYRTLGEASRVTTKISLGQNATLNYLPQETILFDGFSLNRTLEIDFADGAKCVGLETLIYGRAAMGEIVHNGNLQDRIILKRNGNLLCRDVITVNGDIAAFLDLPGIGVRSQAMTSIFSVGSETDNLAPRLRDELGQHLAGISINKNIIFLRIIADEANELRQAVVSALNFLNGGALPRVWQI